MARRVLHNTRGGTAETVLYGVLAVFVLVLVALVATVFTRPDAPEFEPSPVLPQTVDQVLTADTVTVDAVDGDHWQFFDFDRQSAVTAPDTAGWDLAFRRFNVIAAGGVQDLGVVDFTRLSVAPTDDYVSTTFGQDTTNAAIDRWYTYGVVSHMLQPKQNVFVVRTPNGTYAKLQFLSYYCPGLIAGCVTFRYVYRADGKPRFD